MHHNNQKEGGWVDPSGSPVGRVEACVPLLQRTHQRDWRGLPKAPEANRRWDAPRVARLEPRRTCTPTSIEATDTYKCLLIQLKKLNTGLGHEAGAAEDYVPDDTVVPYDDNPPVHPDPDDGLTGQVKSTKHQAHGLDKVADAGPLSSPILSKSAIMSLQVFSSFLSKLSKKVREACVVAMEELRRRKGGCRQFTVIDESNFRHRRNAGASFMWYGRGWMAGALWRRQWVSGMLGENAVHTKQIEPVLHLVQRRSRRELVPLIIQHVRRGSIILSGEWHVYRQALSQLGYRHYTVNHSISYMDAPTVTHTQHIERAWRTYKETGGFQLNGTGTDRAMISMPETGTGRATSSTPGTESG
ncbi:hypothetical protein P4O66_008823 [Electrophorus voltai]|uniref:ISXO2-like transposase domain-containing protein n=1 Tax=Electrophorus voltai TaxID=2609070 RepID=A0AAD8YRD7_9TELE|nr:hypothetical protein P4O66_008823 [Electrophorus voltai]